MNLKTLTKPTLNLDNLTSYDKEVLKYLGISKADRLSLEFFASSQCLHVQEVSFIVEHFSDCELFDLSLNSLTPQGESLLKELELEEQEREELLQNGASLFRSAQSKADVEVVQDFLREVSFETEAVGLAEALQTVLERWKQR